MNNFDRVARKRSSKEEVEGEEVTISIMSTMIITMIMMIIHGMINIMIMMIIGMMLTLMITIMIMMNSLMRALIIRVMYDHTDVFDHQHYIKS